MFTRVLARIAVAAALAAPATIALAQDVAPFGRAPAVERGVPVTPGDVLVTGSIGVPGAPFDRCPGDSAAEGNANQQNRPVKQYGQTAGGYRC
ncbi:hypothetical protein Q8W71_06755 [Methylobacterium sp. NEAU 140]|uniref:hypothetical protein n=1 Tax=Methylobacterium sp. NEAU 140 TaxID=3064945 RepID=UPI002734CD8A|nr:hypothetical protein [Methylobacterium sp. NEAU 140]MDP4022316.1 hypothetical protein [Methylobacterium sp. NEAU 140]